MAQPYIGEIRMFAGNFAPAGWHFCDGALLPVSEYETLFQTIGTTYGGDGESSFGLPDLRGRIPIHMGNNFILAETGGAEIVTLTQNQIPSHSHTLIGSKTNAISSKPADAILATSSQISSFLGEPPGGNTMNTGMVQSAGGSQPHENMQPYLCVSFIISLFGIFPSAT